MLLHFMVWNAYIFDNSKKHHSIAYFTDGLLVTSDSNLQCLQLFNEDGEFLHRIGTKGRQAGCIQRPVGLASTTQGNILGRPNR